MNEQSGHLSQWQRDQRSGMRWPRAAWVVLLVGIFFTALLTVQYERIESQSHRQHFEDTVDRRKASIQSRLRTYITVLNATAGLFEGSEEVTPDEFGVFTRRLQFETVYEGMDSIGFVQRVPRNALDALVQRMHEYGYEDFATSPRDELNEHYIITHIQPETEQNRHVLGLELGRDAARRAAMREAEETGYAAASKALTVLPQLDPAEHAGFVIYVPVFDADNELQGFVFSSFSATALMSVVLGHLPRMAFEVYDGPRVDPEAMLYNLPLETNEDRILTTARTIDVAGRTWTIVFHAPVDMDLWLPLLPIVGILVTLMFAGIVWNLSSARAAVADRADELRRQREWFQVTLASIGDAVLATDPHGRITFLNERAAQLTGWTIEEAEGCNADEVMNFINEHSGDPVPSPITDVLTSDGNTGIPPGTMLLRRDGTRIPVDDIGAPIRAFDGKHRPAVIGAVVTFRDITERRRAEEALRESQTRLEFALESAQVGEWDFDLVNHQVRRSLLHDRAFGYEAFAPDWDYDIFLQHVHPDDREFVDASFHESLEKGTNWNIECRVIWPDGSTHWINAHGNVYERKSGRPTRMLGLVEDVTERKKTEEQLRRSEERFRSLVTATSSIIWTADGDGMIVHEVESWETFTGQTAKEYQGSGWIKAVHPDDRDFVSRAWAEANQSAEQVHVRYRLRTRDGEYRRVDGRGVPILDQTGAVREWVGSITDIEDQERIAEALLTSEQKFRWIIDSTVDFAIFTFDREGKIDSWNPGAERVLGYKEEDILGKDVRIIFTEEDQRAGQPKQERDDAVANLSALDERWHVRADGQRLFGVGRVMPLKDDHGTVQGFVKILHDRTKERHAQEELELKTRRLQESESRFRTMADSAPVYIWMAGTDANYVWFNRPMLQFTGRSLHEEINAPWFERVHPDEREACKEQYSRSFDDRQAFKMKYRQMRHDGQYRWILNHGVPLLGPSGTFAGYIGSCIDITELEEARETLERHSSDLESLVNERTAKLRESHEQLRLAERMALLGTLAAGIGHDLGNLLLPIRVRLDIIEQSLPDEERENVQVIRTSSRYLGNLAKGLRYLATDPDRQDVSGGSTDPTDLSTWWREAQPLLLNALPKHVTLHHDIPDALPSLKVTPAAMTQAVFNLVQNSGNALRNSKHGHVRVWAEVATQHDENNEEHTFVRVGVSDDGPGMDEEVRRRCIEPFYSTKTRELSTGLGLSLVNGVVKRAGGHLEIESSPGQGSAFVLCFPVIKQTHDDEAPSDSPDAAISLSDARIRAFVSSELKDLGCRVNRIDSDDLDAQPDEHVAIWIVDRIQERLKAVNAFVGRQQRNLVVAFGDIPVHLAEDRRYAQKNSQIIQMGDTLKPSTLRDMLRKTIAVSLQHENDHHDQRDETTN